MATPNLRSTGRAGTVTGAVVVDRRGTRRGVRGRGALSGSDRAGIVVADAELRVIHATARALDVLSAVEDELRAATGVTPGELVGSCLLRLHRDPAAVTDALADPARLLPYEATLVLGATTLRTRLDQVTDVDGTRSGHVLTVEPVVRRVQVRTTASSVEPGRDRV